MCHILVKSYLRKKAPLKQFRYYQNYFSSYKVTEELLFHWSRKTFQPSLVQWGCFSCLISFWRLKIIVFLLWLIQSTQAGISIVIYHAGVRFRVHQTPSCQRFPQFLGIFWWQEEWLIFTFCFAFSLKDVPFQVLMIFPIIGYPFVLLLRHTTLRSTKVFS